MKIATYNIWNSEQARAERLRALYVEIRKQKADVLALQEVSSHIPGSGGKNLAEVIAAETGYKHWYFAQYPGEKEGLAFFSSFPIVSGVAGWNKKSTMNAGCAIRMTAKCGDAEVSFTNVHLSFESALKRENQTAAVAAWIASAQKANAHEVLLGDFNSYPESSVHRFLSGQQSLGGTSTGAGWWDLAASYASRNNCSALSTLDFRNNPRWRGVNENGMEIPGRFDWILLKNCYPRRYPKINMVKLFGVKPLPGTRVVPSDHYGVLADVSFNA